MRILASAEVRRLVSERGGRVYVWATSHRCCNGRLTLLNADTTRPSRWRDESAPIQADGFELCFDAGALGAPEDLVLELRGRRRRIRAFWNGCAYVV